MKKYRPIIATLIALVFYTSTDILIWQRVFEANQLTHHANTYHIGWFVSLAGYALLGMMLMWGAWKDVAYYLISLFVTAFSGLEDVLYYILDGKPMPAHLPWLEANPMIVEASRTGVISSVLFWIAALIALYVMLYEWRRDRTAHAPAQTALRPGS